MGKLYQHGTLATLVPGLFAGTQTLSELLTHGDTGIGTLTGLNGELIILDGVVYQMTAAGQVLQPEATAQVPFANVHYADFTPAGTVTNLSDAQLRLALQGKLPSVNLFTAVTLTGTFAAVTTRAVREQQPPYPTLTATAADQAVFTREQVTGTVIGYWSPTLYAGMAAPGFHLHFLNAAHDFGGHILALTVASAALALQPFADIQLHLPSTDPAFLHEAFDESKIVADIVKAES
ncbi:acetolactate decarboxylase [Lacticaseibacillus nasuensis]|uniref:Alpha-acetolactate decarboxylase n=1 Tax=Lacticaseibacillus nasuensis JCM 17158 TaxID=1291734 RepID=A0A0R1JMA8_9LACO|nr:acetolactate decarboxylase [Lacticaseibacillus nasuensis]KRK72461.1 alpha-acetolactate decarboxylase [Lacticaseibacillus nasuensis JCM 17158]